MSPWTPRGIRPSQLRDVAGQLARQRREAQEERSRRAAHPWALGVLGPTTDDPVLAAPDDPAPDDAPHDPAARPDHRMADQLADPAAETGQGWHAGEDPDDSGPRTSDEPRTLDQEAAPDEDPAPSDQGERQRRSRFGTPGKPLSRNHPFVIGFMGATGALVAWFLLGQLGKLSSVLTSITVAVFLSLALDPVVRSLQRRGIGRGASVAIVSLTLVGLIAVFASSVVPRLVEQATDLSRSLPAWVDSVQHTRAFEQLDERFSIVATVTDQLEARLGQGETIVQLFGGVLGAGQALVSGFFGVFTVVVLTIYFTASMDTLREAVYQLAPRSRRPRVRLLGDEIIRRIGGYTAGQIAIATVNGVLSYVLMLILHLPFPALLALTVGVLGLIPLIGASMGAAVVTLVALFSGWQYAVIVLVYYVVYQQLENYVIAPRVMSRTVQVPGFLAVIAALIGAALLGVLGALIAIPVAAGILLIIQEVVLPRQEQL